MEILVTIDVLLVMRVLQLVGLHVLPEGLDDAGASLSVNTEQASQARVQLKLGRLRRQHNHITALSTAAHIRGFTSAPSHHSPLSYFSGLETDVRFKWRLTWTVMFVQAGVYRQCEACRLSLQQLISRHGLVTA